MLRERVITALVLLLVIGAALFYLPLQGWWGLCALVAGVSAWEWGGLAALSRVGRLLCGALSAGLAAVLLWVHLPLLDVCAFAVSALFWLLLVPAWLKQRWRTPGAVGVLAGFFVLLPAALALGRLRESGPWLPLAVMAVVWVADIAAYFGGRALGRNKLAPEISPGKTWEGAVFGVLGSLLYAGLVYALALPQFPARVGWLPALAVVGALAVLSIVGDLLESLLKRQIGVKDSSALLPGHGGVLDRIDGLLPTLPLAALWYFAWSL